MLSCEGYDCGRGSPGRGDKRWRAEDDAIECVGYSRNP
jgi:hypothetical protein